MDPPKTSQPLIVRPKPDPPSSMPRYTSRGGDLVDYATARQLNEYGGDHLKAWEDHKFGDGKDMRKTQHDTLICVLEQ
jgi:hypothetical protein